MKKGRELLLRETEVVLKLSETAEQINFNQ